MGGWDGAYRAAMAQRFLSYAEGRTDRGNPGPFTLTPATRTAAGDYEPAEGLAAIPFNFMGKASVLDQEDAGREVGIQLALVVRVALDVDRVYLHDERAWTVESRSEWGQAGTVAGWRYVLFSHVE